MPSTTFRRWHHSAGVWHLVVWRTIRDKQLSIHKSPMYTLWFVDCVTIRNEAFCRVLILFYVISLDWSESLTFVCSNVHLWCTKDTDEELVC